MKDRGFSSGDILYRRELARQEDHRSFSHLTSHTLSDNGEEVIDIT